MKKKIALYFALSSFVANVDAHAAGPVNLLQSSVRGVSDNALTVSMPTGALVPRASVFTQPAVSVGAPISLLPPVTCFREESWKACAARRSTGQSK